MKKHEGLVGGIVLVVVTALALMLSGCGSKEVPHTPYPEHEAGFMKCEKLCGARPVAVQWDHHGCLLGCRCDLLVTGDEAVE
jgi:hypothetical protein